MALPQHLKDLAAQVSNWGRWGAADRRGTINLIDAAAVPRGIAAARQGRVTRRFATRSRRCRIRRSRPILRSNGGMTRTSTCGNAIPDASAASEVTDQRFAGRDAEDPTKMVGMTAKALS